MSGNVVAREAIRGATAWAVLACLRRQSTHGYALLLELRSSGWPQLKGGTLYPILHRLEQAALVESAWEHDGTGPGRRVLTLLPEGRRTLEEAEQEIAAMVERVRRGRDSAQG